MPKVSRLALLAGVMFALSTAIAAPDQAQPTPPPAPELPPQTPPAMPADDPGTAASPIVPAAPQPTPKAPDAPANAPAPVAPSKDHKTLAVTEFTSETPPGFSIGSVKTAHDISRSAVAQTGDNKRVWVFNDRILTVFECAKNPCINDASGTVYELVGDTWRATDTRLRPWTTLVYVKDGKTVACIKPVVVRHSGVKAYCYAADRSWREPYFIRAPKPEICAKSLRMIQRQDNQHWLTELELPSGKIQSRIAVNPPFKTLCAYQGPIKPENQAKKD